MMKKEQWAHDKSHKASCKQISGMTSAENYLEFPLFGKLPGFASLLNFFGDIWWEL